MNNANLQDILKSVDKGLHLRDERGRTMRFPRRQDYVGQLKKYGLIGNQDEFVADDQLTKAVYLDWLRRPQVGCVFAQLLARSHYRTGIKTVVARGDAAVGEPEPRKLATEVDRLVGSCVQNSSIEAVSVLLPQILTVEGLAHFVWELSCQPGWSIEREHLWRRTLVQIGLRVEISDGIVAETLGMGPFDIFPPTRQCPVTTLEIRTKPKGAKKSQQSKTHLAVHLANVSTEHMLSRKMHRALFSRYTPWLRKRILGHKEDTRAKARVTYSLPVAIWEPLKTKGP